MNVVYCLVLGVALVLIQCFIGGTRMVYALPFYLAIAAAGALSVVSIRRPCVRPSPWALLSTLVFAGYVIGRGLWSPNPYLARMDIYMAGAGLIVYLLTALYLHQTRFRNWLLVFLGVMAVLHVIVGAMQFKEFYINFETMGTGTHPGFMLFGFDRSFGYGQRASGQLICPNHLAGYLEAIALIMLSLTVWGRGGIIQKLLTGYVALFSLLGLAITASRGGYLSFTGGFVAFLILSLWALYHYSPRLFKWGLLASLAGGGLLIFGALWAMKQSPTLRNRLEQIDTATSDIRLYNWKATLDQYASSPVWGTGAGTHLYLGRFFRYRQLQADPQHAHGDYLELLAEYGAVGAALCLPFLLLHLGAGFTAAHRIIRRRFATGKDPGQNDSLALKIGALCAVLTLLAHSVVDFNMHVPGNALLFAFLFGVLGGPQIAAGESATRDGFEYAARSLLPALAIAYLYFAVPLFPREQLSHKARKAFVEQDWPKCVELCREAIAQDPGNYNLYFYQGESLRAQGMAQPNFDLREDYLTAAVAAYRAGTKVFPQDENFWVRIGQCLDGMEAYGKAEEAYRKAIETDPQLDALYHYYAAHLRLSGRPEDAAAVEAVLRDRLPEQDHGPLALPQ